MAEDIAREIIAQSKSSSNLAFCFGVTDRVLLYKSKDVHDEVIYHVWKHGERYEFKYADLESATDLVRAFVQSPLIPLHVILHDNLEEVAYLGEIGTSFLSDFLQDKMKLLDAINVEDTYPAGVEEDRRG